MRRESDPEIRLRAFLGSHGCQTHILDSDEIRRMAALCFAVDDGGSLDELVKSIDRLGPTERKHRVYKLVPSLWPKTCMYWPAGCKVRRKSKLPPSLDFHLKLTRDEIIAKRDADGGWSRETLEGWGMQWPPPKGWRKALESIAQVE